jgi:DNA ligase-1
MFKPMLAGNCEDLSKLQFPLLASTKIDGVRASVQGGKLLSRMLKPIPNINVQELFRGLPEGLDGELVVGEPTEKDAYRKTTSLVISDDKPAEDIFYHIFDRFSSAPFKDRIADATKCVQETGHPSVVIVEHLEVSSIEGLDLVESKLLEAGYEGVMIRSLNGPYKQGRSSENQGYLLKLKRFQDAEGIILSCFEEMRNENTATKNLLGHTERSTKQAGKVAKGTLGGFTLRGLNGVHKDVEFNCGNGFTALERADLWKRRESLLGLIVRYKYFPGGSKDRPRFPTFLGFRDVIDIS